jgi:hypothetical protein
MPGYESRFLTGQNKPRKPRISRKLGIGAARQEIAMNYSGNGDVYKEGQKVARVRYDLTQTITFIDTGTGSDTGRGRGERQRVKGLSSAGGSSTAGTVTVVIGKIEIGEEYELRLDNGNTVSFFPNHHSANRPSRYTVTVW